MAVDVYSLDFDGSLAHVGFLSQNKKDIILANTVLLELINQSGNKKIVLVGSNRQAISDDFSNSRSDERGSCYPATLQIAESVKADFDNFLMADLYNDLPDGTCFEQALPHIVGNHLYSFATCKDIAAFPNWIHDVGKMTVLYAQIQKMANQYPNEAIRFHFFDDRIDILENLHAYFTHFPELIPHNVSLHLQQYAGTLQPGMPMIQGINPQADKDYRNTVKNMAAVTIEAMHQNGLSVTSSQHDAPIANYQQASNCHFDISTVNCVKYYEPGMIAKINTGSLSPQKEKRSEQSGESSSRGQHKSRGALFFRRLSSFGKSRASLFPPANEDGETSQKTSKRNAVDHKGKRPRSAISLDTPRERDTQLSFK